MKQKSRFRLLPLLGLMGGLVFSDLRAEVTLDQVRDEVLPLLMAGIDGNETNEKVRDLIQAVIATYGPNDVTAITQSVESVELSTPQQPEFKIPIRDIVFHTTLLVPSRIEAPAEFLLPASYLAKLNVAMGY